mgnify:CR=1 FL=1
MNQSTDGSFSRFGASAAELRREFKLVDRDRDGRVDVKEFKELMLGLESGMSEQEMRSGFHEVDTDRDGLIDQQEFIEWWNAD